MPPFGTFFAIFVLVLAGVLLSPAPGRAAGGVPLPAIATGNGEDCVEDPQVMRRWHMELLRHQRDETVRRGIRTKKYSLKECIACHAVKDAGGVPVTADDPRHFCRACHDYAAVRIDCFDCHASRPPDQKAKAPTAAVRAEAERR